MGRGKRDTVNFQCRLARPVVEELQQVNPSLVTREPDKPDQIKFRHGALGRYVEGLIRKDIRERKAHMQDELLAQFNPIKDKSHE